MPKKAKKDHPPIAPLYDQLGAVVAELFQHPDCSAWLYNALGDVMLEAQNMTDSKLRDLRQAFDFGLFVRHAKDYKGMQRRDYARAQAILILQGGGR